MDSLDSLDSKVNLIDDFIDSTYFKRLDFSFGGVVLINSFMVSCNDVNFYSGFNLFNCFMYCFIEVNILYIVLTPSHSTAISYVLNLHSLSN